MEWQKEIRHREDGRYREYRIPGIVVTQRGTILLVCEARMDGNSDWGRIDVQLDRSTDGGSTWTTTRIAPCDGAEGGQDDTFNNPTLIADGERVHLIFHKNYARAFYCRSEDDGCTWSRPAEITQAYREFDFNWNVCATGPGHGIALRSGRLVAPVWIADGKELEKGRRAHWPSVAGCIFSDDRGQTWHAGPLTEGIENANETSVAERADGSVLFNFRSMDRRLRRFLGVWRGDSPRFESVRLCEALRDPMCFGGMASDGCGRIAFVHCDVGEPDPASPLGFGPRRNLRIHVTADGGETWTHAADVDDPGGYADIAFFDGDGYVFCEKGGAGGIQCLTLKKIRI